MGWLWVSPVNVEQSVQDLSAAIAEQLQAQLLTLLHDSQATIEQLRGELESERQRREAAEAQLIALQHQQEAMEQELIQARATSAAAADEIAGIHAAIAAQLEHAEAEHQAQQAAEAAREQHWREQLEALQAAFQQERFWRELLQGRVEALRRAAADLFSMDGPSLPPIPISAGTNEAVNGSAPALLTEGTMGAIRPELAMSPAIQAPGSVPPHL